MVRFVPSVAQQLSIITVAGLEFLSEFSRIEQLMGPLVIIIFQTLFFSVTGPKCPAALVRIATYRGQFAIDFPTRYCRSISSQTSFAMGHEADGMGRPCVAPCT